MSSATHKAGKYDFTQYNFHRAAAWLVALTVGPMRRTATHQPESNKIKSKLYMLSKALFQLVLFFDRRVFERLGCNGCWWTGGMFVFYLHNSFCEFDTNEMARDLTTLQVVPSCVAGKISLLLQRAQNHACLHSPTSHSVLQNKKDKRDRTNPANIALKFRLSPDIHNCMLTTLRIKLVYHLLKITTQCAATG